MFTLPLIGSDHNLLFNLNQLKLLMSTYRHGIDMRTVEVGSLRELK